MSNIDSKLADLNIETIATLCGLNIYKGILDPKNPAKMADNIKVTFRPLPFLYTRFRVIGFRTKLRKALIDAGVNVVPWKEATVKEKSGFFSMRKVRAEFHAVVDVKKQSFLVRKILSNIVAERIYSHKRSPNNSVMEILKLGGWADDFTLRKVKAPFATQVITLMKITKVFSNKETTYDKKISIGLNSLIGTMSELVLGVRKDTFSLINMNLSDATYPHNALDGFIEKSLIPKIYAPIRPPMLNRFKIEEYNPSDYKYPKVLTELGYAMEETKLYPEGVKLVEKIKRPSLQDALSRFLDGRTGVSYGFIAMAEDPVYYDGEKRISEEEWNKLTEVEGYNFEEVRKNTKDRWYVKTDIGKGPFYQQLPDVWIVTSRSGCEKTKLNPDSDVMRIGLSKGKLRLQMPSGVSLKRKDIRPSFDTEVILAQALSCSLYLPELLEGGMPILHFHGYPNPRWFSEDEHFVGEHNPSLPCGTMEAALLNYSGVYELAQKGKKVKMFCLVESDHGVNILGFDKEYMVQRLKEGVSTGNINLGGRYLPDLKKETQESLA